MRPELQPVESGDILNNHKFESTAVDGRVGNQLSQTTDVHAARDFFHANSGQPQLPDLKIDAVGIGADASMGSSLSTPDFQLTNVDTWAGGAKSAVESALSSAAKLPGLESQMLPGADQALLPGLEQGVLGPVPPGGEPISPLVQMILKMPGLMGVVGDFFSALMAFFFPADGGLMAFLDPTMWAAVAQNAFTSLATVIVHDLPLTLTTLGTNNPFQTMLQNGLMEAGTKVGANPVTLSLEHQPFSAGHNLNVGGSVNPGTSLYEMNSVDGSTYLNGGSTNIDVSSNRFIAMEGGGGGNSFAPTIGGSQVPTAQMTQVPSSQVAPPTPQPQVQSGGEMGALDSRGSLINEGTTNSVTQPGDGTAPSGDSVAPGTDAPAHHMVERGDNLWNIAKQDLGSGSRWTEIYELNKNAIGSNPDLIYSGTDLKLPGADGMPGASDYVVRSGDNLWNISRDHLGGGQNWHSLYNQNTDVIGSNPDLIYPGEHLAMPDGGAHMQMAHHSPAGHAGGHATTHATNTHHTAPHQSAPSHQGHTAHHTGGAEHQIAQPHAPAQHAAHAQAAHAQSMQTHQVAHAKPATTDSALSSTNESVTTEAAPPTEQVTDTVKTEELGQASHTPEDLRQEIGLKAVARSL